MRSLPPANGPYRVPILADAICSTPCKDAYQRRLAEETKVKIGHLDFVDGAGSRNKRFRAA